MRGNWMRLAVVGFALVLAAPAASAGWLPDGAYREDTVRGRRGPLSKLGRGLTNIVTSPAELIRTPQAIAQNDGWGRGLGVGVPYGLWRVVLRAVVGAFETVTFFAEVPDGYEPLLQPEFVFESRGVRREPIGN